MTPDEELDHTPIGFGKHKGKTPEEIAELDPEYLIWAKRGGLKISICSDALFRATKDDVASTSRHR